MLTVAIPTYGRNETLLQTLPALLPQLTNECRLLILDNCSPMPVADTLRNLLAVWPSVNCRIFRHRCNLGATANILRCFELSETEWIWTLGDDDIVSPNAISSILYCIYENQDADYISFLTTPGEKAGRRATTTKAQGVSNFIRAIDDVGGINFMSCSVWKVASFEAGLRYGYDYAYSMGWAFALLLNNLGDKGQVVFSHFAIINAPTLAPIASRWSYRKFLLGWATLLEIPNNRKDLDILAKKMLGIHPPEVIAAYLLADAASCAWPKGLLYYDLVAGRVLPYNTHVLGRVRLFLYRFLFIKPRLGWWLVRNLIALANRIGYKSVEINDMEKRSSE